MSYTFHTELTFSFSDDADEPHRVPLILKYTITPGAEATREEPGYGASVNVQTAYIKTQDGFPRELEGWMWLIMEADEALMDELIHHARCIDEWNAEQAADAKREEARLS